MNLRIAFAAAALFGATTVAQADLLSWWSFNNTSNQGDDLWVFQSTDTGFQDGEFVGSFNIPNSTLTNRSVIRSTYNSGISSGVFRNSAYADVSNLFHSLGRTPLGGGATSTFGDANAWGSFSGTATNRPFGTFAGGSMTVTGPSNNGRGIDFSVPTTGYEDLVISYDTRGTPTGFDFHNWYYSTDGVTYVPFEQKLANKGSTWSTFTVDFSSVAALDNLPRAWFRIEFEGADVTSSNNGNSRIDNLQINGDVAAPSAIPAPSAGLAGLALLGGLAISRSRKQA